MAKSRAVLVEESRGHLRGNRIGNFTLSGEGIQQAIESKGLPS